MVASEEHPDRDPQGVHVPSSAPSALGRAQACLP